MSDEIKVTLDEGEIVLLYNLCCSGEYGYYLVNDNGGGSARKPRMHQGGGLLARLFKTRVVPMSASATQLEPGQEIAKPKDEEMLKTLVDDIEKTYNAAGCMEYFLPYDVVHKIAETYRDVYIQNFLQLVSKLYNSYVERGGFGQLKVTTRLSDAANTFAEMTKMTAASPSLRRYLDNVMANHERAMLELNIAVMKKYNFKVEDDLNNFRNASAFEGATVLQRDPLYELYIDVLTMNLNTKNDVIARLSGLVEQYEFLKTVDVNKRLEQIPENGWNDTNKNDLLQIINSLHLARISAIAEHVESQKYNTHLGSPINTKIGTIANARKLGQAITAFYDGIKAVYKYFTSYCASPQNRDMWFQYALGQSKILMYCENICANNCVNFGVNSPLLGEHRLLHRVSDFEKCQELLGESVTIADMLSHNNVAYLSPDGQVGVGLEDINMLAEHKHAEIRGLFDAYTRRLTEMKTHVLAMNKLVVRPFFGWQNNDESFQPFVLTQKGLEWWREYNQLCASIKVTMQRLKKVIALKNTSKEFVDAANQMLGAPRDVLETTLKFYDTNTITELYLRYFAMCKKVPQVTRGGQLRDFVTFKGRRYRVRCCRKNKSNGKGKGNGKKDRYIVRGGEKVPLSEIRGRYRYCV